MSKSRKVIIGLAYIVGGFVLAMIGNVIAVELFLGNKGMESIAYIPALIVMGMGVYKVITGLLQSSSADK